MYHTKYKQTVKVFTAPVGLAQARPNYKTQKGQVALLPLPKTQRKRKAILSWALWLHIHTESIFSVH